MVESVRLGKDALRARFALSERVAVRVGALLARGIGLTAAVLEEATRDRSLEALLLDRRLLEDADTLDDQTLHSWGPLASSLTIVRHDEARILALQEEVLAEKAWASSSVPSTRTVASDTSPSTLRLLGADLRLTPEQLPEIRLVLLTSVDADAKIEALRKLVYAPVDPGERGALVLRAITDPDPRVRQEAAAALERLGLNRALADAMRATATGTSRQKSLALQQVASLASRGTDAERSVAVAMLAASLAYERDTEILSSLLDALHRTAETVATPPERVSSIVRNTLRVAGDPFDTLAPAVRKLLSRLGELRGSIVAEALWQELPGLGDRRLSTLALEILCGMAVPADILSPLCARVAEELSGSALDDPFLRRLADAFSRLREPALAALLSTLQKARDENRPVLIALCDRLLADGTASSEDVRHVAEAFLHLLRAGSRAVRATILETRTLLHPRLEPSLKGELATELVAGVHVDRAGRLQELTTVTLRRMGPDIAESLLRCMEKSPYPQEQVLAAKVLADIAAESTREPAIVEKIIARLRQEETGGHIPVGLAVRCVGRAASSPCAPAKLVLEIYEGYWNRITSVSYAFDALVALTKLATGKACDPRAVAQLSLKLLDLLESPMPDPTVSEQRVEEGTCLVIGAQTVVYTDYIPELIEGVRSLWLSGNLRESLKESAVERLCAKFIRVIEYQDVWAPGNIVDLAGALGDMASQETTPLRQRLHIIETLLKNLRNLTMMRTVGRVCHRPDEPSSAFATLVGQFVRQGLEMLGRPEYEEPEDQRTIIDALGYVAANRLLDDSLRARIVDLLIENRASIREARTRLAEVARSEHIPPDVHRRILAAVEKKG